MSTLNIPQEIVLDGLDGTNPLAFLATLGLLRAADIVFSGRAALSWDPANSRPTITASGAGVGIDTLCDGAAMLIQSIATRELARADYDSPVLKIGREQFRNFSAKAAGEAHVSPRSRASLRAAFAAAFGCDAIADENDETVIAPTRLSHANNQGGKVLLAGFRQMAAAPNSTVALPKSTTPRRAKKRSPLEEPPSLAVLIRETVTTWHRRIGYPGFRWEPDELRQAAFMSNSPSDEPLQLVPGANLLAVLGLTLLPSVPGPKGLISSCLTRIDRRQYFVWPLWTPPLSCDAAASLLVQGGEAKELDVVCPNWSAGIGVFARFAAERYSDAQKNVYFCPSIEV